MAAKKNAGRVAPRAGIRAVAKTLHPDHAPTSQAVQRDGAPMLSVEAKERQKAMGAEHGRGHRKTLASPDAKDSECFKSSHQAAVKAARITRPASTWRDVLRAHERRAAVIAKRFLHKRSAP